MVVRHEKRPESMKRRTFLIGGISGAGLIVLTACTPPPPEPVPTPPPTEPDRYAPIAFERTNWSADPFSLGAQSYLAAGASVEVRNDLRAPVANRVFWAGEATTTEHAGTVAGAWLSGLRVAAEVAQHATDGERIAIIGAGLAGAAAARQLTAAGHDVVVLEGRNRVGGRIHTATDDDWGIPVERGAAYLRGVAGNALVGEVAALGLETSLLEDPAEVRRPDGAIVTPPALSANIVRAAAAWAGREGLDASLLAALDEVGVDTLSVVPGEDGVSERQWLDHYIDTNVETVTGATARDLSAVGGWVDELGAQLVVLGGYTHLVRSALADIDVRLSSAVTQINYGGDIAGVRFATGESLQADRIIVTVPLGVLRSGAIEFDPPLPDAHTRAIGSLGIGSIEKVLLRFSEPFWESDAPEWTVVGPDLMFRQWLNLHPLTGEAVLVGTVTAEDVSVLADLSDEEVLAEALASIAVFESQD